MSITLPPKVGVHTGYGPSCCGGPQGLRQHTIRGFGNLNAQVVIIGIAPGRDEATSTGRPFTGPAGQLLDAMLESVGLQREQVYCTNLICWWCDAPTRDDIETCLPRLAQEVATIHPKLIVPMGVIPNSLFFDHKLGSCRGAVIWDSTWQAYVMPTWHPAAVLHASNDAPETAVNLADDMYRDLNKVNYIVNNYPIGGFALPTYELVSTVHEAQQALDSLRDAPRGTPTSLDIETSNEELDTIDVFTDELLCFGISQDGQHSIVFPGSLIGTTIESQQPGWHNGHHDVLKWPQDVHWTFHNGAFDVQGIYRHQGQWLAIHEDTMLQSYTIDERQGVHGLKALSREYAGGGWYESAIDPYRKGKWSDIPKQMLYEYNGMDAAFTWRLQARLTELQIADNVRNTPYMTKLLPAANVFARTEYVGAYISKPALHRLMHIWASRWLELEEAIKQSARNLGWPNDNFNPGSPKQLANMLYSVLGLPLQTNRKTHKPTTDKVALQVLTELSHHPFLEPLNEFRQVDRNISTYGTGIDRTIKSDGCVHSTVLIHGTRTGRLSYRNPPLQDIPNDFDLLEAGADTVDDRIRSFFIARPSNHPSLPDPNTGHERGILQADYSQIELWQAHIHSGDPQLLYDLTEPLDLLDGKPPQPNYHTRTGCGIFNCQPLQLTKRQREITKRLTFGIMYGRQAKAIGIALGITEREAQTYIDRWLARYPMYAQWREDILYTIKTEGELVSATGRKRRFRFLATPNMLNSAWRQAINCPLQVDASDSLLESLIELYPTLAGHFNTLITFAVHDAILADYDVFFTPEIVREVVHTMTAPKFGRGVSVPVVIATGKSWGAAKDLRIGEVENLIAIADSNERKEYIREYFRHRAES